jgi:hypothetical protein
MAARLSALLAGRPLPPDLFFKIPGTHFCYRLSRLQGHNEAGGLGKLEKIHLIRKRSRDLPACSIVPQPPRYRVPQSKSKTSKKSA